MRIYISCCCAHSLQPRAFFGFFDSLSPLYQGGKMYSGEGGRVHYCLLSWHLNVIPLCMRARLRRALRTGDIWRSGLPDGLPLWAGNFQSGFLCCCHGVSVCKRDDHASCQLQGRVVRRLQTELGRLQSVGEGPSVLLYLVWKRLGAGAED